MLHAIDHHPFDLLVQKDESEIRVAEAALLISTDHCPGLKIPTWLGRLDMLARRVENLRPSDAGEQIDALRTVLVEEEGLTGNQQDFYDPRNSFLSEVLERRAGIPISLSVIWLDVAEQLGWTFAGLGLPGYYIIKSLTPYGETLIDPYTGGTILQPADCQRIVSEIYGLEVVLTQDDLEPTPHKATLVRMLNNLRLIYVQKQEWYHAKCVMQRLLALQPASKPLHQQFAFINANLARMN